MTAHAGIRFLADIPTVQARERGDRIALVCEDRTVTYAELEVRANAAASLLIALGVQPGDRVAWLGRSCESFFEIFFGAAKACACLTPINSRLAAPEIAFILADCETRTVFVTPEYFKLAETVVQGLTPRPRLVAVGGGRDGFESYKALAAAATLRALPSPVADDDVLQLYTSGTTGQPKGVRLTNANYAFFLKVRGQVEGFNYGSDDTVLIVLPLFHVAGANISLAGLASGGRVIILPDFSPAAVLRLIDKEKIAHVFLVPAMIQMLLQAPEAEGADVSSLKTVAYGASPIGEAVLAEAQARFGCGFVQFYGMTESAGTGSFLAPSAHTPDRPRSCGKPWPGLEMQVQNADGEEAAVGEIGEIAIRGGSVMAGYWNRDAATAATVCAAGWLKTGDAGFCDAEGFFFVHDRVKDMIVSGGENVYPAEVESAILGCPGVADVAVVGVPSERWGEEVKAIAVALPGQCPTPQDVIAWARQRIAGYKAPKSVDFVETLPRNASGKILRRELRAPYWEGRDRMVG